MFVPRTLTRIFGGGVITGRNGDGRLSDFSLLLPPTLCTPSTHTPTTTHTQEKMDAREEARRKLRQKIAGHRAQRGGGNPRAAKEPSSSPSDLLRDPTAALLRMGVDDASVLAHAASMCKQPPSALKQHAARLLREAEAGERAGRGGGGGGDEGEEAPPPNLASTPPPFPPPTLDLRPKTRRRRLPCPRARTRRHARA